MHHEFDLLHSHCYRHPHGEIARLVGRCRNIPTILHGHGGFFSSSHVKRVLYGLYDQFAKRRFLNQFDHYIALTDFGKEKFVALGVDETKVSVIPNGADDECFEEVNPIPFREKYGLNGKSIILYLGSLHPYKRPDLLIRALPKIVAKVPDVFLLLVGPDTGEYAKLKKIARNLKICNHFKWIGPLRGKEKHQVLTAADFLALPSDEEPFGLVLLEAMAHAKPVIGSDATGPSEIIDNNVTGFITRRGNADDIVTAALKLLTNPTLREQMGRKAQEVAIAKFRVSRVVDQVENLYYRLACGQK
jgi:glycosyltransferase involved in cell wall biosynthesis